MKHLVGAAIAVVFLAAPVVADGMSNAIGHTVRVSAGENSFDATFDADGSYSDTRGITGDWSFDGQLCITVQTEEGANTQCGPWNEGLGVGETWSTDGWSSDGTAVTVEIIG